eukprot:CAMPEP_0114543352 /NCGR_PEP_ID=MMETSP0114-20121206/2309_1 /TAXON_ID=31324 /ORGANISM="Goniomonas sp, Strain m" /LENGTH=117 /DNA_ID=CAMNT_0001727683 /DNA_START=131 /DNA_END=484 /DNA_ORIENTATION=+
MVVVVPQGQSTYGTLPTHSAPKRNNNLRKMVVAAATFAVLGLVAMAAVLYSTPDETSLQEMPQYPDGWQMLAGSGSASSFSLPSSFKEAVSEAKLDASPSGPSVESWSVDGKLIPKK